MILKSCNIHVNKADKHGYTCLHIAAQFNCFEVYSFEKLIAI